MSLTLDRRLTMWISENMTDPAYSPAGLAKFAIDQQATELKNWARLRLSLGRLVDFSAPDTKIKYHEDTMLDAWNMRTWQLALRARLIKLEEPSVGRNRRYSFAIARVEEAIVYAPSSLGNLIVEDDVARFNEMYCQEPIELKELRKRARITLSIFRNNHISLKSTGKVKVEGQTIDGWSGRIWLSAFGFLKENNLHIKKEVDE